VLEIEATSRGNDVPRALDPELEAEGPVRQAWEIEPTADGTCRQGSAAVC
jgi:hypothetical protein